jgi:hypothetical protein
MSKIFDPQRGQPIDYNFLSTITSSINGLWDIVSGTKNAHLALSADTNQNMDLPTTSLLFSAGVVSVHSSNIKVKETLPFSFTFQTPFSSVPVVTATINTEGDAQSKDAYSVITSVDKTSVKGYVIFFHSGNVKAKVNIIAVGV